MGTRSTTRFIKNGEEILRIYKQHDGGIEDWGKELIKFTKSKEFVNGYSNEKQFNGFGDYVLQTITHFKKGVGEIYATSKDDEEEYNYFVKWETKYKDTEKEIIYLTISCDEEPNFKETLVIEN